MKNVIFRYREHPGDLFRNTDRTELPNREEELENFLVQFLNNYQSDSRVVYVDDLFKLLHNEFSDDLEKEKFLKIIGNKTEIETK